MVVETIFIWNFFFEKKKIKVLKNLACHNIFWKVLKKNKSYSLSGSFSPASFFVPIFNQINHKSTKKVQKKVFLSNF